MRARPLALLAALGLTSGAGCTYRLARQDVFTFESAAPPRNRPAAPAGWSLEPLDLVVEGRAVDAWLAARPGSTATLLFFNGNGYSAATALDRLLPRAAALGLDVVALDYRLEGADAPSVAWVRQAARALRARVAARGGPASGRILAGGHSLGAWLALDLASDPTLAGVFALAAGTTPAAVGAQVAGAPLTWVVRLRSDPDVARLDGPAFAAAARVPVLIVGSRADRVMPPAFQEKIVASLPPDLPRRAVFLEGVKHGGYLRDDRVWAEIAGFLHLPGAPPGPP